MSDYPGSRIVPHRIHKEKARSWLKLITLIPAMLFVATLEIGFWVRVGLGFLIFVGWYALYFRRHRTAVIGTSARLHPRGQQFQQSQPKGATDVIVALTARAKKYDGLATQTFDPGRKQEYLNLAAKCRKRAAEIQVQL